MLQNIDSLASHTILLLNDFDELLLHATIDDSHALSENSLNSSHVNSSSLSHLSPELRHKLAK